MKQKKKPLVEALNASARPPSLRDGAAFWADFKARAAHVPQDGLRVIPPPRLLARNWVRVAAALLVLGVSGIVSMTIMNQPEKSEKVSDVQAVDVFTEYSSLLILEDTDHGGTFVWITEADPADHG